MHLTILYVQCITFKLTVPILCGITVRIDILAFSQLGKFKTLFLTNLPIIFQYFLFRDSI